jgi:hypothetical protein
LPYPGESDPPDGATQIANLANALDAQFNLSQHYCTNTAGTSIPDSTDTTVTGWATISAVGIGALTTGVRTITVAGFYAITANLQFPTMGGGVFIHSQILVNGTPVAISNTSSITGHGSTVSPTVFLPLDVSDTVAVTISQNSGSAQTLATGAGANLWSIARLGNA